MAAKDNIQPDQLFHGTTADGLESVMPMGTQRFHAQEHKGEYAHATGSQSSAWGYAEKAWNYTGQRPRVYEVRPTGEVEKDPERDAGGNLRGVHERDVRSRSPFSVVREMPVPEELEHLWGADFEAG